ADLHVNLDIRVRERLVEQQDVPRDLRDSLRDEQLSDRGEQRLQLVARNVAAAVAEAVDQLLGLDGQLEFVLVADRRGRVDRVDHDLRLVFGDELIQRRG